MNFKISGHHLDITPPLREYVETKLERIVRHFDQVIGVSVLLSVDIQKKRTGGSMRKSIYISRARTSLSRRITKTCMPPSTHWSTSSTGR